MIKLKLGDIVFLEDINVQAIVQSVGCRLSMGNVETFFKENGVIQKILGRPEPASIVIELIQTNTQSFPDMIGADDVLQGETNDE